MAAVITSTDSPEVIQAALKGKNVTVQVQDELGDDVTASTGNESNEAPPSDGEQLDENAAPTEEEGESSGESATPGKEKEPPAKEPSDTDKRIDGLIKQVGELTGKLSAATAPKEPAKTAETPKPEAEPQAEDFNTQGEYLKALSKWAAKEARKEMKAEQDKEAGEQRRTQTVDAWNKQVATAKTKYKDWDSVMGDTEIGEIAARTLISMPDGAELAYYVGKNPEEAKTLVSLKNERDVAIAIGELRAKVKSLAPASKKDPATVTGKNKPAPITPLGGNSSGNVDKKPSEMTYKEYKAKRNQEIAAKRKSA